MFCFMWESLWRNAQFGENMLHQKLKHVAPGTILCGAARLPYSLSLTRCLLLQRPPRAPMVSPCAEQKFSTV